ncbi:MAG: CapA family protein, partial [Actinomycetota bacterium]|nr:CapA family protein [Actinomycetota bacterium]
MRITPSNRKWLIGAALVAVVVAVPVTVHVFSDADCGDCLAAPGGSTIETSVKVVSEAGDPLEGAKVKVHGIAAADTAVELATADDGTVRTPVLSGPAVAVVEAEGYIVEPVPLGWSDGGKQVEVRLFAKSANRFAMHSTGDVMFGRRYAEPAQDESSGRAIPLIPNDNAAAGAEQVVAAVAPAFAAADLRTVNLETVVSDKPTAEAAYPGKRFILNSVSGTVAGLKKLSVDVAVLANNHSRDLLDPGVADTRAALSAANINMVGAGKDAAEATVPFSTTVNGTKMALLAYSSVDGSFVNTSFPDSRARKPSDLPEKEQWQYEARDWGFSAGAVTISDTPRRIREAWSRFVEAEKSLGPDDVAQMWTSLVAVYPEMQDWVARRGHGGAAVWDDTASTTQIRETAANTPMVMVQVHAGFQFQDAASDNMRDIARASIDAGADIVVAHHPHVVQGLEWYKGKLIAYSMGNFIFDQNFLSTFSSAFLRTVWDGDKLLEARLMPIELVDYQPVPVTDATAARVLARMWERSDMPLVSYRDDSGAVRARPLKRDSDSEPARIVLDRHTGRVLPGASKETTHTLAIAAGQTVDLPAPVGPQTLTRPTGGEDVQIGRDLFGFGTFEDDSADGLVSDAMHWSVNSKREGAQPGQTPQGLRFMRLETRDGDSVQTRSIARIALPRHRVYKEKKGKAVPTDPKPSYSMTAMVRRATTAAPEMRFEVYHFDDSNP